MGETTMQERPDGAAGPWEESETARGRVWVLAPREKHRLGGVAAMLFGAVFAGIPLAGAVSAVADVVSGGAGPLALLSLLFTLPFLLVGALVLSLGQGLVLGSHSEVELTPSELVVREQWGLIPLKWRRPLAGLTRIVVARERQAHERQQGVMRGKALRAEFLDAKPVVIGAGYPRETLVALGDALRRACSRETRAETELVVEPELASGEVAAHGLAGVPVDYSEAWGLEVERRGDAVLIHVPPAGIRKGSKGVFFMGIFFCAFIALFAGFTVLAPVVKGEFSKENVPFLLGSLLFGTIGVGLLVAGWNMGRRTATCAATPERLVIERKSIFGLKRVEWTREQLQAIAIGPSGTEINGVPVLELQVRAKGRSKFGLLSQRTDDEIRWIAAALRQPLGLE